MICARCCDALQYIVSNNYTQTTGSEPLEELQLRDDERHKPERLHEITHHPTYGSLGEAIDRGCSICLVLWETMTPEQQSFLMHASWPHEDSSSATSHKVCTRFDGRPRRLDPSGFWINKRWVARCARRHKRYNAVSGDGPCLEQTVSLIETAKVAPAGRYTTLATHSQLAERVPLGSLPQLMQDAIFVSLELGIRYLWVDLLCIYQDEDDIIDWQHESALMHQPYSDTICNISAGDANGCLESLFSPRDPVIFLPQVIELKIGDHDDETGLFRVYDLDYWHRSVSRALVNTRAWVLQQRFLSSRVLQFDRRQVLWECLEKSATETCPKRIPSMLVGNGYLLFKNLVPIVQTKSAPDNRFSSEVGHTWTCLVKEYTACDLTVPSDKLTAISGIAKHIASLLQDDHVSGMWRSHLEGELLWYVKRSCLGKTTRLAKYRAPSWSWASIDGPVQPGWFPINHSLIKVEEVYLEYLTGDVFGAFQLVCSSLNTNHRREWDMILEGIKVPVPEIQSSVVSNTVEVHLDAFYQGFAEQNASDMLFAMFTRNVNIQRGEYGNLGHGNMDILLLKLIYREKAIFERIGLARAWHSAQKEVILKVQRPRNAPALPGLDCGNGIYSICVL
ncbi:hypothetical protein C8A03DRAFT_46660 [Achaetomium macrosporum]|uniref:Heterokaryon incompatibility domain-containing protein n=1 Tax=Achaetomium macrosporum TaxID=79813 RepID=A0AAN7C564_9PEZI|nr:hypothetical protein C8A03DRAFT_46660 [Achaetomium macrosporum]